MLVVCTSTALERHFHGTSMALPRHFHGRIIFFCRFKYIKLYWCFYPHRSSDSLSPVCGIFYVDVRFLPNMAMLSMADISKDRSCRQIFSNPHGSTRSPHTTQGASVEDLKCFGWSTRQFCCSAIRRSC